MFKPTIDIKLNLIRYSVVPEHRLSRNEPNSVLDPGIGIIERYEQHGMTLYLKGADDNAIVVMLGTKEMKVLHEYSHLIPTWMKEDFNRFLKE